MWNNAHRNYIYLSTKFLCPSSSFTKIVRYLLFETPPDFQIEIQRSKNKSRDRINVIVRGLSQDGRQRQKYIKTFKTGSRLWPWKVVGHQHWRERSGDGWSTNDHFTLCVMRHQQNTFLMSSFFLLIVDNSKRYSTHENPMNCESHTIIEIRKRGGIFSF